MTDKPQWMGKTVYLITDAEGNWDVLFAFTGAAKVFHHYADDPTAHVWECQIGQTPIDVTDEARKLMEKAK